MSGFYNYGNHLTRQEDGTWCWRCSTGVDYYMRSIRYAVIACVIIGIFVLVFGAILAIPNQDWEVMAIFAGCDAVFALITFVVCWIFSRNVSDPKEIYELHEDYVRSGSGRSSIYFEFSKAKEVVFTEKYIELKGKLTSLRVYVPEEDMSFVKNHIMSQLPGDAEIRYE